ncbi:MAG: tyrosine-type recombinase/integrase [Oscillospiraceae bacterium]
MANITPRKNKDGSTSYLIRVYVDENNEGKQKVKSMTWKPPANMSDKKVQKELQKTAALFEEQVKKGLIAFDCNTTFAEYSTEWLKHAATAGLAERTRENYADLLNRINAGIGHIRLSKLEARHIKDFEAQLLEPGAKQSGGYAVDRGFADMLKKNKISKAEAARRSGVSTTTVITVCKGRHIQISNAEKLAAAFGAAADKYFDIHTVSEPLSDKSVLHHHRLISHILATAKRERLVPFNVASEHMQPPKIQRKEARYLDDEQAQQLVDLLFNEPDLRIRTPILLSLYTGVRRGELCGLEWKDIDKERGVISIVRASQYQRHKGIVTVPTKNASSERAVKVPKIVFDILDEYKEYYNSLREQFGTAWTETDRLFVRVDKMPGKPINPDTINFWLDSFIKKNGLEHFTPHSLRHTFATLQISAGVPIRVLQARTGHAQASTLVNIYSHAIKSADEAATEALDNMLTPAKRRTIEQVTADEPNKPKTAI